MAHPLRHQVKMDQVEQGLAFFTIHLEGDLTAEAAQPVMTDVAARVEQLAGRPFGLLFDLRGVTSCDAGGAGAMQRIELGAADKGLEVVAHLVKQTKLVGEARAALDSVGAQKWIATFDDEAAARRFASGLS